MTRNHDTINQVCAMILNKCPTVDEVSHHLKNLCFGEKFQRVWGPHNYVYDKKKSSCPLIAAILKQRLDLVNLLLDQLGFYCNPIEYVTPKSPRVALSVAVEIGNSDIIRALINHGARVDAYYCGQLLKRNPAKHRRHELCGGDEIE